MSVGVDRIKQMCPGTDGSGQICALGVSDICQGCLWDWKGLVKNVFQEKGELAKSVSGSKRMELVVHVGLIKSVSRIAQDCLRVSTGVDRFGQDCSRLPVGAFGIG